MYFYQIIAQFFHDTRTRKLRIFLAMFGIAWGTIAVVLLLAIGGGFHAASSKAMHGMGESIVVIWPSRTTKSFEGMGPGRPIQMRSNDVVRMGSEIPQIGLCSPELNRGCLLSYGRHRNSGSAKGVIAEYGIMRNLIPQPGGRFLNPRDIEEKRRVVFIGNGLKKKLFEEEEPVGDTILVNGRPFLVVGVLKEKNQNSMYGGPDSDASFIPYTTFISMWGDQTVSNIIVRPEPPRASEPMKKAIYRYLGEKYRFDPEDKGALMMWDTVESDRFLDWFFWGLRALLGLGGALTLVAGGIGVANVMYLIVRERTREIGIRMAVGARDWHIMLQFMLEAALIIGIGGLAGFGFSALVIWIIPMLPLPDWLGTPLFSPLVGIVTVGVLSLVVLAAGIFPARRAAGMDPVRALEF